MTVEHFAFTGSLWDRRYRLLGCPFRSQLCLGKSNLLLVHRFLLRNRSTGANFRVPAHTRGSSPIGRYPVGLLCMVDVLCSGAILHLLRRKLKR